MQDHLVSIVIPFKNTENYLEDCLNSIVQQSYTNFEVFLIDDGSTDKSGTIVNSYANTDNRINVYNNTGTGIIKALQLAYSKSKGTFITRMDSDDIMNPNRLAVMVNSLLEYGPGHIAVGQVEYFSEAGVNDGYAKYEKWLNALTAKGSNFSEIYKECVIPSPCWMVFKTDFDLCGGFNSDTYPEDYDLAFRFYEQKLKCIPCDKTLHQWRDYSTRTSRTSEHYAENYFLDLKLDYFVKLDYKKMNDLVVLGAGKKGKKIAQKLVDKNINFSWICNNKKKIGKHIYNVEMHDYSALKKMLNPQIIVTVANEEDQLFIRTYLNKLDKVHTLETYFFC